MKYRVLGRTGLKVSELGFGGHEYRRWLPRERDLEEFMKTQPERNRLIEKAIDLGVNYFDTTHAEEAESLGLALKDMGRREDIHVAVMIFSLFGRMAEAPSSEWGRMIRDDVEEKLKLLSTDYADILTVIGPGDNYSPERLTAAMEILNELKREGRIGFVGASSHQPRFLAELMRRYDCFDTVMVVHNYHSQEAKDIIFPLAKALNVGVVVMKPLAWPYYGIPFMRFGAVEYEKGSLTPAQVSLRWILNSPEVSTVVPSMNSPAELQENVEAIAKEDKVDETVLLRYLEAAQSPEAKEKLTQMLKDPALDMRHYAKRALKE